MSCTRTRSLGKASGLNAIIMATAVIGASTSAAASGCTSNSDLATSRARWTTVLSRPTNASDGEADCRLYAGSFYGLVTLRQDAASCTSGADRDRKLAALDSDIDAFNDLLATKCGG